MTMDDGSIAWPHLEYYSDQPVFNTKAVVQRTGVPAPTLRAWERRYALLSPERAENAYRLYSERDIAVIRWLKERVDQGMAISQAVALFRYLLAHKSHVVKYGNVGGESGTGAPVDLQPGIASVFRAADVMPAAESSVPSVELEKVPHAPASEPVPSSLALLHRTLYPTVYDMQSAQNSLIDCFQEMDESRAHILMGTMFTLYSVEQICMELITPTMHTIGQLWADGGVTTSVEHFASNFFRGLLTNLLHVSQNRMQGPLVLACCAPGEPHELAILMLSLLLRRQGMHVVYLGQSIEIAGVLHTIRKLRPAALCVSLTIPTYVMELEKLARQVASLPEPHSIFIFGGQAFSHVPYMIAQIPGVYLEGNLHDILTRLCELISTHATSNV